ncbi:MAG: hypothetical protein ACOYO1_02425 [Bacteroidales bacterium]
MEEQGDLSYALRTAKSSKVDIFINREISTNGINYRNQNIVIRNSDKTIEFPAETIGSIIAELTKLQDMLFDGKYHAKSEIPYSMRWLKTERKKLEYMERYEEARSLQEVIQIVNHAFKNEFKPI